MRASVPPLGSNIESVFLFCNEEKWMTNEIAVPQHRSSHVAVLSESKASAHLPALDGVRGIAILLVLFTHLSSVLRSNVFLGRVFGAGWIGVDLFFVLSGFLITRILVNTGNDPHYYSRFYIRRGLRIWPLYFTYVLALYFGLHFISQIGAVQRFAATSDFLRLNPLRFSRPLIFYLLFIQNLVGFQDLLIVTWSLCVEEHFYLIWPILVRKFSVTALKRILWTSFLLSPVLRLAFFFFSRLRGIPFKTSHSFIYHSTPFHLDSIIAGCLLGLYWMECRDPIRFRIRFWVLFLVGAIASSIMLWFTPEQSALYCFSFTFLAMLFAGLVGLTLLGWNRAMFVNLAPKVFWQDKLWILFDSLPDRQRIPKPSYSA